MQFDLQPTLEGSLVVLRPLTEADFEVLYAAASDPRIWEQHPERDRWTRPVFQRYFSGAMASGGAFLVLDAATEEVLGSTRYHDYREEESEIEIGWTFLVRSRWGGPHNREMKRLMLNHAFRFVNRVVFTVGPENFRSRRAVEKLGAVLVGPIVKPDGAQMVLYQLDRDGWARE